VVVIGLIWPTIVNLLVFGSFFRPREERGVDLSGIRTTQEARPAPVPTEQDMGELARIEEELQGRLTAEDVAPTGEATASPVPAPIRPLSQSELDAPLPEAAGPKKCFGKDEDDYYPTEVRSRAEEHE